MQCQRRRQMLIRIGEKIRVIESFNRRGDDGLFRICYDWLAAQVQRNGRPDNADTIRAVLPRMNNRMLNVRPATKSF